MEQAGFLCPPWKAASSPGLAWLLKVWGSSQVWGSSCAWALCVLPNSSEALASGASTSKSREGRLAKVSRVPHCAWLCQEVRLMGTGGPENAH